ncbi:MAG TPA: hypothetical protein PKW30_02400, partial [Campylobacterales bacterium]|nr:hypothetical protein [Campylobacterales bacterium]
NIKKHYCFLKKFACSKKEDKTCDKCEQNREIEEFKNANAENLFYYIDKLEKEVLKDHFDSVLGTIKQDAKNNKNRALVCFDRLLARLDDEIDFSKLAEILELDERFRLIIASQKSIPKEKLQELCNDKDEDVRKVAIFRLKNEHAYRSVDKFHFIKDLKLLKDFFPEIDIKAEEEKRKAEEEKRKAEEEIKMAIKDGRLKLILLIAKSIAIDEESELITKEHIVKASDYVIFDANLDKKVATILCEKIGESRDKKARYDFERWLTTAYMADKMNYDEEAKEIVGSLKEYKDQKICSLSPSTHQMQTTLCERLKNSATSKDILLLAKWIANSQSSEAITLEHIQKATVNFEIIDAELKELLGEISEYEMLEAADEKIKEAQNIGKKPWGEEFKQSELFKWLNANSSNTIGRLK